MTDTTNNQQSNEPEAEEVHKTDLFHWANRTDGVKNELECELFVFNRHYTPFSLKHSSELKQQVRILFLFDVVNYVNLGAGTGMSVREFEKSEAERDVVLQTRVENVELLNTLRFNLEDERAKVETFSETDHEMRKMKGLVARFWHRSNPEKFFYVIKAMSPSAVMPGLVAWQVNDGGVESFSAEAGLKIPPENQILVVDDDVFVFAAKKFENLFRYNVKEQLVADAKVAEIEKAYKLSFPDGLSMQELLKEKRPLVKKLQDMEIGAVSHDQAIDYADEMQLELMTDTDNSIIIMDGRDLDMFVALINEDFITSERTGRRFKITKKKLLDEPSGEPPRG